MPLRTRWLLWYSLQRFVNPGREYLSRLVSSVSKGWWSWEMIVKPASCQSSFLARQERVGPSSPLPAGRS